VEKMVAKSQSLKNTGINTLEKLQIKLQ